MQFLYWNMPLRSLLKLQDTETEGTLCECCVSSGGEAFEPGWSTALRCFLSGRYLRRKKERGGLKALGALCMKSSMSPANNVSIRLTGSLEDTQTGIQ